MKHDIIISGVGGQGILSLSFLIVASARAEGFEVQQSEIHGMAQRGGSVVAQLRMADRAIQSGLIPRGQVDLILSMEPMEGLRYADQLAPEGMLLASSDPVINIPDYPPMEELLAKIGHLPRSRTIPAARLAREAGSPRSTNVVMVGAATPFLPLGPAALEDAVRMLFARKGTDVVEANLRAFRLGLEAMQCAPA
ncbi:MAG: indolepyruvate oxidoreductase subunit beta [Acidobacteriota bacterium]|jgi:indolepyruvate ferredoxin oxidoreductase beta subunit